MTEIVHDAQIIEVLPNVVRAEIKTESACKLCVLKNSCQMHETSSRIIDIPVEKGHMFQCYDHVKVAISLNEGFLALFWGYIFPLMLVLMVLFAGLLGGLTELSSGICSIIVLIPYYFGLSLKKNFWKKKLHFKIVDKN